MTEESLWGIKAAVISYAEQRKRQHPVGDEKFRSCSISKAFSAVPFIKRFDFFLHKKTKSRFQTTSAFKNRYQIKEKH